MRPSRRYSTITGPDGRTFHGTPPHLLSPKSGPEAWHIARLAEHVNGLTEVTLPAGRADVATRTDVWEVEPIRSWRHGAQQAYAYGAMSGLRPNLGLFGKVDVERIYLKMRHAMPTIRLWVWYPDHMHWRPITSRRASLLALREWRP